MLLSYHCQLCSTCYIATAKKTVKDNPIALVLVLYMYDWFISLGNRKGIIYNKLQLSPDSLDQVTPG